MKREELDFLEKEQVDKVMALYGKALSKKEDEIKTLTNDKKDLSEKITTYETKINEFNESSKDNAEWKKKYEELQTSMKEQEAQKKAEEEDKILTNNISQVFGEKKFVNDYTKNSIINEIKTGLKDSKNLGKSAKDLFEEITKDKEGIFVNPNQPKDMPGTNPKVFDNINKESFGKMGYRERLELKAENPDLFEKLNSND